MSKTFAEFSLHETLQQALEGLGFTSPTPVQEQAIPAALAGKDLLVSSQTGSGKTAAFLLPTLNALAGQETFVPFKERMKAVTQPSILVLCPTVLRESCLPFQEFSLPISALMPSVFWQKKQKIRRKTFQKE
jgi:superfamily II DNA/RNA helicase